MLIYDFYDATVIKFQSQKYYALCKVWIKVHNMYIASRFSSLPPSYFFCSLFMKSKTCFVWNPRRFGIILFYVREYVCMYVCIYAACSRETRISRVSSFPINPYDVATGAVSYNICMVSLFTVTACVTHVQLAQFHALLTRNMMRRHSASWGIKETRGKREISFRKMPPGFSAIFYLTFKIYSNLQLSPRMRKK